MFVYKYRSRIAALVLRAALMAALVSSGLQLAKAQGTAELYDYPQTALNGIVSAQIKVSIEACRELCSARSGCTGFDHSSNDGVCRLFASVGSAMGSQSHTAATRILVTGYRPPTNLPASPRPAEPPPPDLPEEEVAVTPSPATFRRFLSRDLTSEAAETREARSVDMCESMCRASEGWCRAFTYDDWNRKCFLKERVGQLLMNARATSGVMTGIGAPSASGATVYFEYFNNKAFPGNGFRRLSARNRNECEGECWGITQCMAFTFTQSQGRCVIFDRPGEYSSQQGATSGAKRQE